MRTLVDLPEDDIHWLDNEAMRRGWSRAALVREAVTLLRAQCQPPSDKAWLAQAFGMWKDRDDIRDAVEYQRRLRAEWTRPWDPDYDEVRAEFPDLFTAEDDAERERYRK